MAKYFAVDSEAGPCVARRDIHLGNVIVCECLTRLGAEREAARMNREQCAREALRTVPLCQIPAGRRVARYFPNEETGA